MLKPTFNYNDCGVKDSCHCYRNINGIHYECWTADHNIFEDEKRKAKELGLKFRMIKGDLYREVRRDV